MSYSRCWTERDEHGRIQFRHAYGFVHPMTREQKVWVAHNRLIRRAARVFLTGETMPTRAELNAAAERLVP